MFKGKNTCKILKDIRRQIAESNDIEFVTSECQYQGDCSGTCPKCEAELRYLEAELNRRRQLGKAITLAGLSLGLSTSLGGCHSATTEGEMPYSTTSSTTRTEQPSPAIDNKTENQTNKLQQDPETMDVVLPGLFAVDDTENKEAPFAPSTLCTNGQDFDLVGDVEPEGFMEESDPDPSLSDVAHFAEEMPEFPGGQDALKDFLQHEIKYPDVAKYNGITGTVLVEFVVEMNGEVSNAKVKVPLFPDCDKEAVRAIMAMPKWKPAFNLGEPVRCFYQVPVSFKLQ